MSEMVQKMPKKWSTHHQSSERTKPEQSSICCCMCKLFEHSAMVVSSFTKYKPLRLLQICINKKTISFLVGTTRDWIEQLDHNKYWHGALVNVHTGGGNCHVIFIKKSSCRGKLACVIPWETMLYLYGCWRHIWFCTQLNRNIPTYLDVCPLLELSPFTPTGDYVQPVEVDRDIQLQTTNLPAPVNFYICIQCKAIASSLMVVKVLHTAWIDGTKVTD